MHYALINFFINNIIQKYQFLQNQKMQKNTNALSQIQRQIWVKNKYFTQPDPNNQNHSKTIKITKFSHDLHGVKKFYKAAGILLILEKNKPQQEKYFISVDDYVGLIRCPAGKKIQNQWPIETALREFEQQVFNNQKSDPKVFWNRLKEFVLQKQAYLIFDSKMVIFVFTVSKKILKQLIQQKKYFCIENNGNYEWIQFNKFVEHSIKKDKIKMDNRYQQAVDLILNKNDKLSVQKIEQHLLQMQMQKLNVEKKNNELLIDAKQVLIKQLRQLIQLHKYKYKTKEESNNKIKDHVKSFKLRGKQGCFVTLNSLLLLNRLFKKL